MVGTPIVGACLIMVLFLRQYTLKRTVVRAGDEEKGTADVSAEVHGEGIREEKMREPMNDTGDDFKTTIDDVDEKRSLEGDDVTVIT